jgi:hypothetical protein
MTLHVSEQIAPAMPANTVVVKSLERTLKEASFAS